MSQFCHDLVGENPSAGSVKRLNKNKTPTMGKMNIDNINSKTKTSHKEAKTKETGY